MAEVREVHTHSDSGGGVATGMVLGIILVVLAIAVAVFVFFGNSFGGTTSTPSQPTQNNTKVEVNPPSVPSKVDVQVNPPAQQSPSKP